MSNDTAVHVVIFPLPAQGHLNSMLNLAELLVIAGLHVTFLNSDHNHRRLFCRGSSPLTDHPRLRFSSLPDGLPDDHPRSANRLWELVESLEATSSVFRDLLLVLCHQDSDGYPPVTCVIADGVLPFATDVAEELGIPAMAFRTPSACAFWAYFCIPKLSESGELPFPDGADLDEPIRGVPGMESFLRRSDLPSFCRRPLNDPWMRYLPRATARSCQARALIFNSTEALEWSALSHIRSESRVIYAIGPLHALLHSYRPPGSGGGGTASLWQEDRLCMAWLDAQPDRSVVYVSFGSYTVMSQEALFEFWAGLVGSGHRFLWVARPDMIQEEKGWAALPEEAREAARARCRIVGWAPQKEVLAHRAVGCFLTHSGWNSTVEAVVEGVPMVCWPFFADQQTNSRFVGEVWRVGLDMKDVCQRDVVQRMVREAMEGETAAELRRSAQEKAEMARRSVVEGGSSFVNFQRLVQHLKSLKPSQATAMKSSESASLSEVM